jgi:hypothetical protein
LLNSFRLTADARYKMLDAIVGYNKAQFAMYVALGNPPAAAMAKAIPDSLVPLPAPAPPLPACAPGKDGPCPPPKGPMLVPVPNAAPTSVKEGTTSTPAKEKGTTPTAPQTGP